MLEVYSLFSGSQGNSYYVTDGKTRVLIDAGKTCLAINKSLSALGTSLNQIDAIFVTHEHSDHTCGLEVISKKHQIPVYMTKASADASVHPGSYLERFVKPQDTAFEKSVGSLCLSSFSVPHDSVQNVGYVISSGSERFGLATDIGHVTSEIGDSLSRCKKIIIESNHDIQMLKNGDYPQYLKDRILSGSGHLSNDKCAEMVAYLADLGVCEVTLAHLSRENNLPLLAYNTTKNHLLECGLDNVILKVAHADRIICATDGKEQA